ncbi:centromere protein U isoform X2 [Pleurodeles waltl]
MKRHIVASDISSILKEGVDNLHDDELDEFYDHPLHSTAVEAEPFDKGAAPHDAKSTQPQPVSPPKKQLDKRKNLENNKVNNSKPKQSKKISEKTNLKENTIRKTPSEKTANMKTPAPSSALKSVKKAPKSQQLTNVDTGSQEEVLAHTLEAGIQGSNPSAPLSSKTSLITPVAGLSFEKTIEHRSSRSISSDGTTLTQSNKTVEPSEQSEQLPHRKKRKTGHQNSDITSPNLNTGNVSLKIWCPDGAKRSPRDITELDIALDNFSNIITSYKRKVESDVCMRTVDSFLSSLKKQLTGTIEEVQKLKAIQRKNTKIVAEINKKRKRLLTVNEELSVTERKLKQLQKECAQLEENKSSLRSATQFLNDLRELQKEYMKCRKKDPKEKEEYGVSSLPALLLESRSILCAEKHLQGISSKLQMFLDKERQQETQ